MRFLADESCDFTVVRALREAGRDVTAIAEINPGIDDEIVIALAHSESRILLTEDKDFGQLAYAGDMLAHGHGADAQTNWFATGVAQALAARHRVIAIDLRGHGRSDKPHDPSKYGDRLWRDVVELMDHFAIRRAHFHGYSLGAAVVWNVFARHPERVSTVAIGGGGMPEVDPAWIAKLPPDEDARADEKERTDPDEAEARRRFLALPNRDETALEVVLTSLPRRPDIDLAAVRTPMLVIAGEYDQPIRKTQRLKRELTNFTSVILPGKTHLTAAFPGYIPDLYIRTLVNFIDANDR